MPQKLLRQLSDLFKTGMCGVFSNNFAFLYTFPTKYSICTKHICTGTGVAGTDKLSTLLHDAREMLSTEERHVLPWPPHRSQLCTTPDSKSDSCIPPKWAVAYSERAWNLSQNLNICSDLKSPNKSFQSPKYRWMYLQLALSCYKIDTRSMIKSVDFYCGLSIIFSPKQLFATLRDHRFFGRKRGMFFMAFVC